MKRKNFSLALIFVSLPVFAFTSCSETKKATSDTVEAVTETVTTDLANTDTKEKIVDDAIAVMEDGVEFMISNDQAGLAAMQKRLNTIKERAKAIDLDMQNLPEELKAKMKLKNKELQKKSRTFIMKRSKEAKKRNIK